MGCGESVLPLSMGSVPGRETTSDTLLLAELADSIPYGVRFDLGTGTGGILANSRRQNSGTSFSVGIDISMNALKEFDRSAGQPVNCSVEMVSRVFLGQCADLVLANPPYNITTKGRKSPDRLRQEARTGDPLLVYRFIFAAAHLLKPGGSLILSGRPDSLKAMEIGLRASGFHRLNRVYKSGVMAVRATLLRKP